MRRRRWGFLAMLGVDLPAARHANGFTRPARSMLMRVHFCLRFGMYMYHSHHQWKLFDTAGRKKISFAKAIQGHRTFFVRRWK